jgi:DUF917 family protein
LRAAVANPVFTPVTTEVVRTGLRVSVLGLRSSPLHRTPEALRVAGPRAFGYDLPFVSLDVQSAGARI